MVAFNFIALALVLSVPALAHHHHHHPNGTEAYHPGHPTRLPIHPSHGNGGDFHRTTLSSRYRSPTALPSGPRTDVVDDPPFPTLTNTFEETTTRVPGVIYPTGTGGLCGNCTHGNATEYAFAARSADPIEPIHEEKQEKQEKQEKHEEPTHVAHEEHEEHAGFKHHMVEHPTIVPTETPLCNKTQGLDHKMPKGFGNISTFLKRGRGVARATGAPAVEGY